MHGHQNIRKTETMVTRTRSNVPFMRTLPVSLLYVSLTLREERKLRVFENMVLRRIFGPRKDEVMGE